MNYPAQTTLKPSIFDFSKPEAMDTWQTTSDEVRGGFSTSFLSQNSDNTAMRFSGNLSTKLPENRKIRSPTFGPPVVVARSGYSACRSVVPWHVRHGYFLYYYDGIELVVKGDSRTYNFNLYPSSTDSSHIYAIQFHLMDSSVWKTLNFKFRDFALVHNGKVLGESSMMYHKNIKAIGISLQDGLDGDFNLEVKSMAYLADDGYTQKSKLPEVDILKFLKRKKNS